MENTINKKATDTKTKILYYASTTLLTLVMLFSASEYFFNHEFIRGAFQHLGYPTYLIYPMAISKILGLIAIWSRKSQFLTGLAYAGFFYNVILAFFAHIAVSDNSQWIAVAAIIALVPSYFSSKRLFA
ncbi:DoxX family protein [Sphingobacterium sp. 18053]|uniref:DoxX family protein n=1 Tax=Sphingobacterium sp. 18053 TaxID=2681401 RepID=UPI00135C3344|nr:DoxX family protein [Sphingobacterium sp. 18053]